MKLPASALLGLGMLATTGCSTLYTEQHPYTNSSLGVQYGESLSVSKLDRDNQKKAWDDELSRQSESRLETYFK